MKAITAILLLSSWAVGQDKAAVSAAEAACGPQDVRFEVTSNGFQHPTPAPEAGKVLIYVVQTDWSSRFGFDGKWIGATSGSTYFFASIDRGEHHLCAIAQIGHGLVKAMRFSLRELKAEAGTTYYFVPHVYSSYDPLSSWFDLSQVDPDEGKYLVAAAKFSTSHPK